MVFVALTLSALAFLSTAALLFTRLTWARPLPSAVFAKQGETFAEMISLYLDFYRLVVRSAIFEDEEEEKVWLSSVNELADKICSFQVKAALFTPESLFEVWHLSLKRHGEAVASIREYSLPLDGDDVFDLWVAYTRLFQAYRGYLDMRPSKVDLKWLTDGYRKDPE